MIDSLCKINTQVVFHLINDHISSDLQPCCHIMFLGCKMGMPNVQFFFFEFSYWLSEVSAFQKNKCLKKNKCFGCQISYFPLMNTLFNDLEFSHLSCQLSHVHARSAMLFMKPEHWISIHMCYFLLEKLRQLSEEKMNFGLQWCYGIKFYLISSQLNLLPFVEV